MRRAAAGGLLVLGLLAGCASSPEAQLNQAVSDLTERANAGDAPGVRIEAQQLIDLVNRQSGADLDPEKAQRIRDAVQEVLDDAALLEVPVPVPSATPTPTPTPSPSATPTPTPSASPTPTPTPTQTPSPTPTPTPSRTPSRTPSATPSRTPTPTPTASTDDGGGGGGEAAAPTPTAGSPSPEAPDA